MKRRLLPLAVLLGGFAVAALMIATGPEVQPRPSRAVAPLVRVVEVVPKTVQLRTWTHGTVVPRTESDLVPEVDGRIVEIIFAQFAPRMAALDQYFQLDVAAFTVFVRQLDQALASRDRDTVLAIFDGITKLHRETMMRAIEAASHDNQYQTGVVAS